MSILVINGGSGSLKVALTDRWPPADPLQVVMTVRASVEPLQSGRTPRLVATVKGSRIEHDLNSPDATHAEALDVVVDAIAGAGLFSGIDAIAHRVVHGGDARHARRLDPEARAEIDGAATLSIDHNQIAMALADATLTRFAPQIPQVACFDTSFFADLPPVAASYAIDPEVARRERLVRYGFHGFGHRWMARQWARCSGRAVAGSRVITVQLGSGCSMAAHMDGRPVETSMGLTPLEGLVMRTRSGSVDPALVLALVDRGWTSRRIRDLLERQGGLAGVSGTAGDVRELLSSARDGNAPARLAIDLFVHRLVQAIGANLGVLEGADAIVFGGGIGEHSPEIRAAVLTSFEWCGLALNDAANTAATQGDHRLTSAGSSIEAWSMTVDEEAGIASDAADALGHPMVG